MDGVDAARWSLVVPLKPLARGQEQAGRRRARVRPALALAFALDTVAAALACAAVRDVTVVTDDPAAGAELAALGARSWCPTRPAAGLNAALRHGARAVRRAGRPRRSRR